MNLTTAIKHPTEKKTNPVENLICNYVGLVFLRHATTAGKTDQSVFFYEQRPGVRRVNPGFHSAKPLS